MVDVLLAGGHGEPPDARVAAGLVPGLVVVEDVEAIDSMSLLEWLMNATVTSPEPSIVHGQVSPLLPLLLPLLLPWPTMRKAARAATTATAASFPASGQVRGLRLTVPS